MFGPYTRLHVSLLGVLDMRWLIAFCAASFVFVSVTMAADHSVMPLDSAAPADAISPEIAKQLAPTGIKVIRGTSRTVCEIWLYKELATSADKLPTGVNYPLMPGQLVGVIRYPKKGADFRNQDIADGVYTLRYSQQPVDGAHVGTSITRDFLLLSKADEDKSAAVLEYKPLTKQSSQAAGSNHPALLSMQKPMDGSEAIRHDEQHDWWIVRLGSKAKTAAGSSDLAISLVVVGHAAE